MGDTRIMRAVRTGHIRREGGTRLIVKKGVTTAHEGAEIVQSHPHLWEPIVPDFPVEGADLTDAAVEAAHTDHTEALRSLLNGLWDRGYAIPDETPRDQAAAAIVELALRALDGDVEPAPAHENVSTGGEPLPERVPSRVQARDEPCANPETCDVHGTPAAETPGPVEPAGDDEVEDDDQGEPADVVDPSTKEGRDAIRAWAREQDDEDLRVADSGPLPQRVVDAWARAQGGRA